MDGGRIVKRMEGNERTVEGFKRMGGNERIVEKL